MSIPAKSPRRSPGIPAKRSQLTEPGSLLPVPSSPVPSSQQRSTGGCSPLEERPLPSRTPPDPQGWLRWSIRALSNTQTFKQQISNFLITAFFFPLNPNQNLSL